ncbi:MAG TPA: ATP-binding protein [Candidatus Limnocylindrales bacterium]|nr:ATP-binding protein [Candidatus Limnocylindrales bacterium]
MSKAARGLSLTHTTAALVVISLTLGGMLAHRLSLFTDTWSPDSFGVIARLSVFLSFLFAVWWRAPWPAMLSILGLLYVLGGAAVDPLSVPALATVAIAVITGGMLDRLQKAQVAVTGADGVDAEGWPILLSGARLVQLERENERLLAHNRELIGRNRELEDFTYTASHDLKSPLRAIHGFGQALIDEYAGALDAHGVNYVQRMQTAAHRLEDTVDALLELSRVAQCSLSKAEVDVAHLAREIVADLSAGERDRQVELRVPESLVVVGDPALIRIVITNILANAWKFTRRRPDARIEIGRSQTARGPAIYVRDNGIGFDSKQAGDIFRPFERLHASHEFEGSGIGLATVERIVLRHGGSVWAEGHPGRGAAIFLQLEP